MRAGTDSGTAFQELSQSEIGENRTEFRNRTEFLELRNQTESELIPEAELVPQCSTLPNRMYSRSLMTIGLYTEGVRAKVSYTVCHR